MAQTCFDTVGSDSIVVGRTSYTSHGKPYARVPGESICERPPQNISRNTLPGIRYQKHAPLAADCAGQEGFIWNRITRENKKRRGQPANQP